MTRGSASSLFVILAGRVQLRAAVERLIAKCPQDDDDARDDLREGLVGAPLVTR